jgi:hypothetical protein
MACSPREMSFRHAKKVAPSKNDKLESSRHCRSNVSAVMSSYDLRQRNSSDAVPRSSRFHAKAPRPIRRAPSRSHRPARNRSRLLAPPLPEKLQRETAGRSGESSRSASARRLVLRAAATAVARNGVHVAAEKSAVDKIESDRNWKDLSLSASQLTIRPTKDPSKKPGNS